MDITALFKLSSGLYVIGAKAVDDEENGSKAARHKYAGCVVNTVLQATSKPVTLTVCINKNNYTNELVKKTKNFAVSILSERIDQSVIGLFGFHSSRDTDKFSGTPYGLTPSGAPYLKEGVTGYIQCEVINFIDNYTHTIFIAEALEAENILNERGLADPPLTYEYYHKVIKGKTPKNASSYVEESSEAKRGAYKCGVCGYEYPGSEEEFEKLPDDYKCPICGVGKSNFARI